MKYFKNASGYVYAYENLAERDKFGQSDLLEMTQAEVDAHINPPPAPPSVPIKVTMRQARLALHAAGLLSGVEAALDALPEPQRTAARIEWDYSSEVYRHKPFVVMLGQALELSDEQIDNLFITADTL